MHPRSRIKRKIGRVRAPYLVALDAVVLLLSIYFSHVSFLFADTSL